MFLCLLCAPKGFSSRQPTFIKDSAENTWDKLNWALPVQNSNACSVRTRCRTVGILGIVNHHQGLQRQAHLLETAQCVKGYCISLCRNGDFKGYCVSFPITKYQTTLELYIVYTVVFIPLLIPDSLGSFFLLYAAEMDFGHFSVFTEIHEVCHPLKQSADWILKAPTLCYLVYWVVYVLPRVTNTSLIASKYFYM